MSCKHQEELTAYVDGELPEPQREQLRAHLATCASCAQDERLLRTVAAQVKAHAAQELSASLPSMALRRAVLSKLGEKPSRGQWLRMLGRPSVLLPALGMGAAAALAVGVLRPPPEERVDSAEQLLLAQLGEELEDLDVVGLEEAEDVELLQHLHELEVGQ